LHRPIWANSFQTSCQCVGVFFGSFTVCQLILFFFFSSALGGEFFFCWAPPLSWHKLGVVVLFVKHGLLVASYGGLWGWPVAPYRIAARFSSSPAPYPWFFVVCFFFFFFPQAVVFRTSLPFFRPANRLAFIFFRDGPSRFWSSAPNIVFFPHFFFAKKRRLLICLRIHALSLNFPFLRFGHPPHSHSPFLRLSPPSVPPSVGDCRMCFTRVLAFLT